MQAIVSRLKIRTNGSICFANITTLRSTLHPPSTFLERCLFLRNDERVGSVQDVCQPYLKQKRGAESLGKIAPGICNPVFTGQTVGNTLNSGRSSYAGGSTLGALRAWNVEWPRQVNLLYFLPGPLRMNTFPSTSPTPPLCGVQLQYTGVPSWMADNVEWVWCGSLSLEFTGTPHATLGFA